MPRQRFEPPAPPSLNITPLIDMVFILLIFFAVNASFTKEAGVEVERPAASTAVVQEHATLFIAVTADGRVWIEKKVVDPRDVQSHVARLLAENPKAGVVILADKRAPTGVVLEALDAARLAGAEHVAVAATVKP
ncbi:biopolymer transport protein ExbD [Methylomarinovum caldicuralii]|uniref:Biopolymer transport protein ExbD n=1 Tax=Methylomarinovum caldicuralii TaxID=438856 RepID=A0AAU9CE18_9GAMM|nr:biopolymer transporter ExbD [Methylomarinovum caldicuralii]BCX81230.1 biopolymer transport protein ExbD [Methylomarinovum caldicuralii]